jgi:IS30 family transposase
MIRALLERAESENIERHHSPSPKAAPRLSLEKNMQIVALYEDGWKPSQIAEALGTTEWTVHHRLNRNGVVRRPLGMTPAEIREALRLNDSGVPVTELCKRYGRSWKTVAKELRLARAQALGSQSSGTLTD